MQDKIKFDFYGREVEIKGDFDEKKAASAKRKSQCSNVIKKYGPLLVVP